MNKIFKVIFNRSKGCYEVVSEFAKSHTKSASGSSVGMSGKAVSAVLAGMVIASLGGNLTYAASMNLILADANGKSTAAVGSSTMQFSNGDKDLWEVYGYARPNETLPNTNGAGGYIQAPMSILMGFSGVGGNGFNANKYYWNYAGNWTAVQNNNATPRVANNAVILGYQAGTTADNTVVIGSRAKAISTPDGSNIYASNGSENATVIGYNATAIDDAYGRNAKYIADNGGTIKKANNQQTAIGSGAVASSQATAVGNDVYAVGYSSIAIGTDDNPAYYDDTVTNYDYATYFQGVYDQLNIANGSLKYSDKDTDLEKSKYSPTIAQGMGAIAIGSRSFAFDKGSTAVGSLAYALKEGSTAIGAKSRAEGKFSISIGNKALTFDENAIAVGNDTQVFKVGGAAFGNKAYAGEKNSLAFGTNVYANSSINVNTGAIEGNSLNDARNYLAGSLKLSQLSDGDTVSKNPSSWITIPTTSPASHNGVTGVIPGKGNSRNSVAIGVDTVAKEVNSVAIGYGAMNTGAQAVAIGPLSYAGYQDGIALGTFAKSMATQSMALGTAALVDKSGVKSTAVGLGAIVTSPESMALGYGATLESTQTRGSMAIGNAAKVIDKSGSDGQSFKGVSTMAIGNGAEAWLNNSVALGVNSKTDYAKADLFGGPYVVPGDFSIPVSDMRGIISVGSKGMERRITNVAGGRIDTDAVNVGQLKSVVAKLNNSIAGAASGRGLRYRSINETEGSDAYRLSAPLNINKDYEQYVKLKTQYLGFKAREKLAGETYPAESLADMQKTMDALIVAGQKGMTAAGIALKSFADVAAQLKNLENTINNAPNATDSTRLNQILTQLTSAQNQDLTDVTTKTGYTPPTDLQARLEEANYNSMGAKGADSIAYGYAAKVSAGGTNSVAIGKNSKVEKTATGTVDPSNSTAIGSGIYVQNAKDATALGSGSNIQDANNSIAMGKAAYVQSSPYSLAIGDGASVRETGTLADNQNMQNVAIGNDARTNNSTAAIAIGQSAYVNDGGAASVANGIAIGKTARTTAENSIAIGTSAQAQNGAKEMIMIGKNAQSRANAFYNADKAGKQPGDEDYPDNNRNAIVIGNDIFVRDNSKSVVFIGNNEGKTARVVDHSDYAVSIGTGNVVQAGTDKITTNLYNTNGALQVNQQNVYESSRNSVTMGAFNTITSAMYTTTIGSHNKVGNNSDNGGQDSQRVWGNVVIGITP